MNPTLLRSTCIFVVFSATAGCGLPLSSDEAAVKAATHTEGTNQGNTTSATIDGWTVTAGEPYFVDADHIQASVSFEQLTGADTDRRSGGSCLVADLNDKTPCETSADCAHLFLPTGGYHYCLGAAGDTDHKICWTRPSAAGCTRGSRADGDVATTTVAPVLVDGRDDRFTCGKVEVVTVEGIDWHGGSRCGFVGYLDIRRADHPSGNGKALG